MSRALLNNNITTTLAVGIDTDDTTLSLDTGAGAGFPSPTGGDFVPVVLEQGALYEIVWCTARSGDNLTVVRAQEGTSAQAFTAGARVSIRATAQVFDPTEFRNLVLFGLATTADGTNPFAARLNNVLWTARYDADGGDGTLRFKFNKEAAADVASILLQTGFSGRAEVGLIGDDDLTFKVSPDGSSWFTGIVVDKDTGEVSFPNTPVARLDEPDQQVTGGARVTPLDLGTPTASSTITLDPGDRPMQRLTNNAAFTLAPGSNQGSLLVLITNGASAGAITVSGWTKVVGAFTTTNGHNFICSCSVINGLSLLTIEAMQ